MSSDDVPNGLTAVQGRLQALEEQLRQRSIIVPIQNLEPSPVEVTQAILAVVREEDGVFIASFVDANINASGETQLDAVEMLKDVIASCFQLFVNKESVLGEEPKRQLAVLRHFLRMP
jgi:predicted RNase H-like HicB family nuclease